MVAHLIVIISGSGRHVACSSGNKELNFRDCRILIATSIPCRTDSYSAAGRNRVTDIKSFAEHGGLHILFFHFLPPSNSLFIMLNR